MAEDYNAKRPLFGGAIASTFPLRFQTRPLTDELVLHLQDVSNIRQVPDHQEVFADPVRDESLIFELLDLKLEVADNGSATWFLQDLAREQYAEGVMILNHLLVCPFHLVPYDVYQSMAVLEFLGLLDLFLALCCDSFGWILIFGKIPLTANEKFYRRKIAGMQLICIALVGKFCGNPLVLTSS
ncbi:Ran guanine nucleotide release factor [Camellia lanceoleosa]|uniref:Ran guanine nucleotide release factor n=1 Tax=Camellia lanceoleosa TaxID=1840588 RepID=A0ACC0IDI9_9ERIC|nr:Ran guanine nucleotide release factor [Camellia lanceoleosa]